jgi:hypothetical protein
VPPEDAGSELTVVTISRGYMPAVAARIDGASYYRQTEENPGQSFLSYEVEMEESDELEPVLAGAAASAPGAPGEDPDGVTGTPPQGPVDGPGGPQAQGSSPWGMIGATAGGTAVILFLSGWFMLVGGRRRRRKRL